MCRFAIASGRAETDPTYALRGALVPVKSRHYPTITDQGRIRSLGTSIRKYTGTLIVRCALEFAMLTAARSGELCAAQWGEIDPEKKLWVIPASRMKMRRIHTVPLSRQALEVLDTLRPVSGDGEYLFPSLRQGRHVSRNSLTCALRILGYEPKELVVHGFRAMFSTLANEHGWQPDVIERQLAHVERNAVRAAYNHAEHLETRREMMQWWADWLDDLKR